MADGFDSGGANLFVEWIDAARPVHQQDYGDGQLVLAEILYLLLDSVLGYREVIPLKVADYAAGLLLYGQHIDENEI